MHNSETFQLYDTCSLLYVYIFYVFLTPWQWSSHTIKSDYDIETVAVNAAILCWSIQNN